MNYEAIIFDIKNSHHKRGVAVTPIRAVLEAFKQIVRYELPENDKDKVDQITPNIVEDLFVICKVSDDLLEEPRTLKEDIYDLSILVRRDRRKEHFLTPCGIIRTIL